MAPPVKPGEVAEPREICAQARDDEKQDGGEPERQGPLTLRRGACSERRGGCAEARSLARIGGERAQLPIGRHRRAYDGERSDEAFQRLHQQGSEEHAGKERGQRQLVADDQPGSDRDQCDLSAGPDQARQVLQEPVAPAQRVGGGDVGGD